MIFEICELLRDKISEIYDEAGKGLEAQKESEQNEEAKGFNIKGAHLEGYTPVTKETFETWCTNFLEELRMREKATMTEQDKRKTGRQLFMDMKDIDFLTLDNAEDANIAQEEEPLDQEEEKFEEFESGALYDKELFAQELGDEEEVDFD